MRVLLIRPPVPPYTIGLKHLMVCEPLELEYVAAGLDGHEVEIFDMLLERGLERRLRRFAPDVVGTSSYISGVNEVIKLCRAVKRWNPACWTVVGGVQASQAPEDFADTAIDCIVRGDGTTAMPALLAQIVAGKPLGELPGLAFREGDRFVTTPVQQYMPPPDELPLPRRDLVAHLKHRYYYLFHQPAACIKTTWGCWYKCNFCYTWRITEGRAYSRSAESIATELAGIEAEDVYIVDDIFLINRSRLTALAQTLRERGIKKRFLCYGRADFIATNEDLIADWANLGLSAVLIGLEATTDPELDAMAKATSVDVNRQAIAVLRRHGIDTYGSLITQPDYGPAEWERLWRFIEETGLYYLNISPLTPQPGTVIWEQYRDQVTVPREAHGLWDFAHVLLPTRMPLKQYYRALLRTYARACLDIGRAKRLTLRTRPPVWHPRYLRLWLGGVSVYFQFLTAHRHHRPAAVRRAADRGPALAAPSRHWGTPLAESGREPT